VKTKTKLQNFSHYILFLISLYFIFYKININYLSTTSPDYQYYVDYLHYFFNEYGVTTREQGVAYFFIVAIFIELSEEMFSLFSTQQIISNSIQLANLFLYFFGIIGIYNLLRYKKYPISNILSSLTVLNFFPQTINLIVTMKPEILAFALLPWCIFLIELYVNEQNYKYLYYSIIPNILLLTSKATILGMILLLYLTVVLVKKIKIFNYKFLILFIFFLSLASPILYENYIANGKHVFEHTNNLVEMQDIADVSILFNINFLELLTNPFRHAHADSLVGMVLLDTFGDYFQWYAYNDQSTFNFSDINFSSIWYVSHWKQFISLIVGTLFYILIVYFYSKEPKNIYLILPFFGIFILLLQAFGIPQRNFNKLTAELFKTHYYSFLILLSAAFLMSLLIRKTKYIGILLLLIIVFSTSLIYGLFNSEPIYEDYVSVKSQYVPTCKVNSLLDIDKSSLCMNDIVMTCQLNRVIYNSKNLKNKNINIFNYQKYEPIQELENNKGQKVIPRTEEECINLVKSGYKYKSIFHSKLKIPKISLTYLIYCLALPLLIRRERLKTNN